MLLPGMMLTLQVNLFWWVVLDFLARWAKLNAMSVPHCLNTQKLESHCWMDKNIQPHCHAAEFTLQLFLAFRLNF